MVTTPYRINRLPHPLRANTPASLIWCAQGITRLLTTIFTFKLLALSTPWRSDNPHFAPAIFAILLLAALAWGIKKLLTHQLNYYTPGYMGRFTRDELHKLPTQTPDMLMALTVNIATIAAAYTSTPHNAHYAALLLAIAFLSAIVSLWKLSKIALSKLILKISPTPLELFRPASELLLLAPALWLFPRLTHTAPNAEFAATIIMTTLAFMFTVAFAKILYHS